VENSYVKANKVSKSEGIRKVEYAYLFESVQKTENYQK